MNYIANDRIQCNILMSLGECYRHLGRFKDGLDATRRAYELCKELNDLVNQAICLGNMAASYGELGEHGLTIARIREALISLRGPDMWARSTLGSAGSA